MSRKSARTQMRHNQQFLTDFLSAVPDVPEAEDLRKLRVERFIAIDEAQFLATYAHELTQLLNQLGELLFVVNKLEETLAPCRTSRKGRTSRAENGEEGPAQENASHQWSTTESETLTRGHSETYSSTKDDCDVH